MTVIGTLVATVCACELFLRLPIVVQLARMRSTVGSVGHILRSSSISDHWKEQALRSYAIRMGVSSVLIFAYTLLAVVPFFVLMLIRPEIWQLFNDLIVLLGITGVAVIYVMLRSLRAR